MFTTVFYSEGNGSPVGSETPKSGAPIHFYKDTATGDWYIATGAANTDWKQISQPI